MLATGVVCFFLGITSTLAVQGFMTWARTRGIELSWWRWLACAIWTLLVLGSVLFATVSWGEGEPRAALYGAVAGAVVVVVATLLLRRFVLRSPSA